MKKIIAGLRNQSDALTEENYHSEAGFLSELADYAEAHPDCSVADILKWIAARSWN